jgi:undecaprenyl-diphosphatase
VRCIGPDVTMGAVEFPASVQAIDEAILRQAVGAPAWAVPLFYGLTLIGGGWGLLLILPFLIPRSTRIGALWMISGVLVTSGLVSLLKGLFVRIRPCDALGWCTPIAVASPGGHSFPSGHAAGALAFAAFLMVRVPRLRIPALIIGALIAWSRCTLGVHYPSDVLAGSLFGAALGSAFAFGSIAMEKRLAKDAQRGEATHAESLPEPETPPQSAQPSERERAAEADPV